MMKYLSILLPVFLMVFRTSCYGQDGEDQSQQEVDQDIAPNLIIDPEGGDPPPAPPDPTASTNTCGSKTLTVSGIPEVPVGWYWQTSPSGTSKVHGGNTYTASSSGTYYVRAFDHVAATWSNGSGSVTVTVNPYPPVPSAPGVQNHCDSSTLIRGTPPAGITWYWQRTDPNGTSTSNSSGTYTAYGNVAYYIRARNNTTGCWSSATAVTPSPKPLPPTPADPSASSNTCGIKSLSRALDPPGEDWYWQGTDPHGTSTADPALFYNATVSGTYYLRSRKGSNGCWGNSSSVTVTVTPLPGPAIAVKLRV